jgi:hypothetical protein
VKYEELPHPENTASPKSKEVKESMVYSIIFKIDDTNN